MMSIDIDWKNEEIKRIIGLRQSAMGGLNAALDEASLRCQSLEWADQERFKVLPITALSLRQN